MSTVDADYSTAINLLNRSANQSSLAAKLDDLRRKLPNLNDSLSCSNRPLQSSDLLYSDDSKVDVNGHNFNRNENDRLSNSIRSLQQRISSTRSSVAKCSEVDGPKLDDLTRQIRYLELDWAEESERRLISINSAFEILESQLERSEVAFDGLCSDVNDTCYILKDDITSLRAEAEMSILTLLTKLNSIKCDVGQHLSVEKAGRLEFEAMADKHVAKLSVELRNAIRKFAKLREEKSNSTTLTMMSNSRDLLSAERSSRGAMISSLSDVLHNQFQSLNILMRDEIDKRETLDDTLSTVIIHDNFLRMEAEIEAEALERSVNAERRFRNFRAFITTASAAIDMSTKDREDHLYLLNNTLDESITAFNELIMTQCFTRTRSETALCNLLNDVLRAIRRKIAIKKMESAVEVSRHAASLGHSHAHHKSVVDGADHAHVLGKCSIVSSSRK